MTMRVAIRITVLAGGLLLLLQANTASAQVADSTFVQTYSDTLNLRLLWVSKGFDLRARHTRHEETLLYLPRYRPRVGVGGFLWNIGFNLLLPLPVALASDDRPIRRFDFHGSLFARRWLIDGIFHRHRGFRVLQAELPTTESADTFLENMVTKKIQLSISYLPDGERVSLRMPYNQGDRQRATSGSMLLSGSGTYFTIRDPNNVIASHPAALGEAAIPRIRVYILSSKVGYTANLVHKSMFLHVFAITGLDWQQTYYRQFGSQRNFSVAPNFDVRSGVGYDGGSFYLGVYGALDYNQFRAGDWQFQGTSGQVRAFFGIRFTEPKWLHRRKPKFLEDLQNSPSIPLPPIFG